MRVAVLEEKHQLISFLENFQVEARAQRRNDAWARSNNALQVHCINMRFVDFGQLWSLPSVPRQLKHS